MASRAVWKGFLQFSLVAIPVKAYTAAATGGGGVKLNQLHADCHSRIKYVKTCPTHGEVPSDQIVSGYEFDEGKYVVIDPAEVEKLRTPREKAIAIEAFVPADSVDPRYYSGRNYYLLPDGPVGQRSYAVLLKALAETRRAAFARVAMSGGTKQLVLLRPMDNVLVMPVLNYDQELKNPAEFTDEAPRVDVPAEELKLAKSLVDALAVNEFDVAQYRDDYADKLTQLIEARIAGKEVVTAAAEAPAPQVANLMEALQRSLEEAKSKKVAGKVDAKPPKLTAPSVGAGTAAAAAKPARKRKTS